MSVPPVKRVDLAVLGPGAIAASVGAIVWASVVAFNDPRYDLRGYLALIVFSAFCAMALGGLAAPSIARLTIRREAIGWGNSVLTGVLTAVVPVAIILLVLMPLQGTTGEQVSIADWPAGLALLAVSGAAAGLVFRAIHGARPIAA